MNHSEICYIYKPDVHVQYCRKKFLYIIIINNCFKRVKIDDDLIVYSYKNIMPYKTDATSIFLQRARYKLVLYLL